MYRVVGRMAWGWHGVHRSGGILQKRLLSYLSSNDIRSKFVDYFAQRSHVPVKSSSLIPQNDPSLLFTNAGMCQFKDYLLQPSTAPYNAAVTVQKCVRAGGKHNDLDMVGYTPRHHTFFEMLGNFSFGAYSKETAIRMAWSFLLDEMKLPLQRLRVTVLSSDDESYAIWKEKIGLPSDQIVRCGEEDNFWSMGDNGPCGPCSEIFWDTQTVNEADRWLEIWNLVFMQHLKHKGKVVQDLDSLCIDTGAGLERLSCVLQGKNDNYEIDLFSPVISSIKHLLNDRGVNLPSDSVPAQIKILSDHIRSSSFLIADGVIPSNVSYGYVLRRLIRRASCTAYELNVKEPFMAKLVPSLLTAYKDSPLHSDLQSKAVAIQNILTQEEEIFIKTLSRGMNILNRFFQNDGDTGSKVVPGQLTFDLYDSYGFPFDLTTLVSKERGYTVDLDDAEKYLALQRNRGRNARQDKVLNGTVNPVSDELLKKPNNFVGYHHLETESRIVAKSVHGNMIRLVIDPCPFYGFGGGQVHDKGYVSTNTGEEFGITTVINPSQETTVLEIEDKDGSLSTRFHVGQSLSAKVDVNHRQACETHHTSTHLLNATLKKVLKSDSIIQAGNCLK